MAKVRALAVSLVWCAALGTALGAALAVGQLTAFYVPSLLHLAVRLGLGAVGFAALVYLVDEGPHRELFSEAHGLWPGLGALLVAVLFGGSGSLTTAMELERGPAVVVPVAELAAHSDAAFVELTDAVADYDGAFVFWVSDADDDSWPVTAVPVVAASAPAAVPAAWVLSPEKEADRLPTPIRGRPRRLPGTLAAELRRRGMSEPRPVQLLPSSESYEDSVAAARAHTWVAIPRLAGGVALVGWLLTALLVAIE